MPTQRAIAAYVASRVSGGGSNASTNTLNVGQITVANNNINDCEYYNSSTAKNDNKRWSRWALFIKHVFFCIMIKMA